MALKRCLFKLGGVFLIVIEVNIQIKQNFSKSQMIGSLELNIAFVIILSWPETYQNIKIQTL